MLRLLTVHPGPDVGPQAAASLAAASVQEARGALDELALANLVGRACLPEGLPR